MGVEQESKGKNMNDQPYAIHFWIVHLRKFSEQTVYASDIETAQDVRNALFKAGYRTEIVER